MLYNKYLTHVITLSNKLLINILNQYLYDNLLPIDSTTTQYTTWLNNILNTTQLIQSLEPSYKQCIQRINVIQHDIDNTHINELHNTIQQKYYTYYTDIYNKIQLYYTKHHDIMLYSTSIIQYINNITQWIQFINKLQISNESNKQLQTIENNITQSLTIIQQYYLNECTTILKHEPKTIYHKLDENDEPTQYTYDTITLIKTHFNNIQKQLQNSNTYDNYITSFIKQFINIYIILLQQYQCTALGANLLARNLQHIYDELSQYINTTTTIHNELYRMTQITCLYVVKSNELQSILLNTKQGKYILQHYTMYELIQLLKIRTDYNTQQQLLHESIQKLY